MALDALVGTGPRGRVTPGDVLQAAAGVGLPADVQTDESPQRPAPSLADDGGRVVTSLQTAAQLTSVVEVDLTHAVALRERMTNEAGHGMRGRLTLTAFFAKAALEALQAHPLLNASIDADGRVVRHPRQHLGVAFDTPRGLLVPVLRDAGALNLMGLARLLTEVAERAQSSRIGPAELTGATFTLTNTGSRGVLFDTPILSPPQVGALGAGTLVERPVVIHDADHGRAIAIRSMAYLTLAYDHRLIESADAARFLATVKTRLEAGQFAAGPV